MFCLESGQGLEVKDLLIHGGLAERGLVLNNQRFLSYTRSSVSIRQLADSASVNSSSHTMDMRHPPSGGTTPKGNWVTGRSARQRTVGTS